MSKPILGLILVALTTLAACSKPPECGEEQVTSLLKQIAAESVQVDERPAAARTSELPKVAIAISTVTKEGYDKDAEKWACRGKVSVQVPAATLSALNSHLQFLEKRANPSPEEKANQALVRAMGLGFAVDEALRLHPLELQLTSVYEARNWRPLTPADFEALVTFTSQWEQGSKDRLIVSAQGLQQLRLYPDAVQAAYLRQDELIRQNVTEVMNALALCKTAVAEAYAVGGSESIRANKWGCEEQAKLPDSVASLSTSANGVISVVAKNVHPDVDNKTLTLAPADNTGTPLTYPPKEPLNPPRWICGGQGTTIPAKFLPAACRPA